MTKDAERMKDMVDTLPGIERVRSRFLTMLQDRKERIAAHILAAWEGETLDDVNDNLAKTEAILHQISGTAGTLGFSDLGTHARSCEGKIIAHLKGPDADLAICPGELIHEIDAFVIACEDVIDADVCAQVSKTALI
ncbi:Hpt domain-containing protein [Sulfitobacter sediminilitoris]|nr:Hpt domain-containing protein [Sulfitobacter sediminilitoris]